MSIENLKSFFDKITPIPDDEWLRYKPNCIEKTYKKNEYLLHHGEYSPNLIYIVSGLIKRCYTDPNGKEFVHYFGRNGQLTGSFSSIITRQPSKVDIVAIKDSQVVLFNYENYKEFFKSHRSWEQVSRILLEHHFLGRETREYQLLMLSAKQRYDAFLEEYSDCKDQLTNKDIASFLGITPEAFSRLKKRN